MQRQQEQDAEIARLQETERHRQEIAEKARRKKRQQEIAEEAWRRKQEKQLQQEIAAEEARRKRREEEAKHQAWLVQQSERANTEFQRIAQERASQGHGTGKDQDYVWMKRLFAILFYHQGPKGYYYCPSIPQQKLANATGSCVVPATDHIIALLDTTFFGSAKDCLLFGCEGIYYHNRSGDEQKRRGFVSYSNFVQRSFTYSWFNKRISLGNDQYFALAHGTLSKSQVVEILNAIKVIADQCPPVGISRQTEPKQNKDGVETEQDDMTTTSADATLALPAEDNPKYGPASHAAKKPAISDSVHPAASVLTTPAQTDEIYAPVVDALLNKLAPAEYGSGETWHKIKGELEARHYGPKVLEKASEHYKARVADEKRWELAQSDGTTAAYELYPVTCPNGKHLDEAKARLSSSLRRLLLDDVNNIEVRKRYLAVRSETDKKADKASVPIAWRFGYVVFGIIIGAIIGYTSGMAGNWIAEWLGWWWGFRMPVQALGGAFAGLLAGLTAGPIGVGFGKASRSGVIDGWGSAISGWGVVLGLVLGFVGGGIGSPIAGMVICAIILALACITRNASDEVGPLPFGAHILLGTIQRRLDEANEKGTNTPAK